MTEPTSSTKYRLSKSKIAAFEHCPKRLWLQVHRRHEAQFDETTLQRFRFGHEVGERARFAVRNGILIDTGLDMEAALRDTADLIAAGTDRPIFEATFQHEDVLVRVDILAPDGADGWHAIEVKASSGVKAYALADLATQIWVMRNSGLHISKAIIRHLANRVRWWSPDIAAVTFQDADVTQEIERFIRQRPAIAATAREGVRGPEPIRGIGMHCYRPFACEFRDHCQKAAGQSGPNPHQV